MAMMWWVMAAQMAQGLMQGGQAHQQGMAEADAANVNSMIAEGNAGRARSDAALAEEAQRREARQAIGRAAAAAAQTSGAGPGQGSLGLVNQESARLAELDALNIRYGGESEAYAQMSQAQQFRMERKAAIQRAKGGMLSGVVGGAANALSSYGSMNGGINAGGRGTTAGTSVAASAPRTQRRHYTPLPRGVRLRGY